MIPSDRQVRELYYRLEGHDPQEARDRATREVRNYHRLMGGLGITAMLLGGYLIFAHVTGIAYRSDIRMKNEKQQEKLKIGGVEYILQEKDVIGKEVPEKFYEIDGQRFYLEIDGKPLEGYFKK